MSRSVIPMSLLALTLTGAAAMADGKWPDLPVPVKNGIGVQVGDTVYVGLGTAGKALYALSLTDPTKGWVKRADYAGPATNGAAAAASGGKIYVFSGNGLASADAKSPIIFETVSVYDPGADSWATLPVKTPAGLSGAKALPMPDGRIVIIGGYNKELFDKYLADVTAIDKTKDPEGFAKLVNGYMGQKPEDYRWNKKVLAFDPAKAAFSELGDNAFPPNCDSGIAQTGEGRFTVISGEIKPGLRTPVTKSIALTKGAVTWEKLADLPAAADGAAQEGIAGAFAGAVGDTVLAAGGANFPGASAAFNSGKLFAHDGLKKTWRTDVYALSSGAWRVVGQLPRPLGYGVSFAIPGGILVVGGEDGEGKARPEVFALTWNGSALTVED